jgi:hypothetical protein
VIFLPKFHRELNFIEQCWDFAKQLCRGYPMSTNDANLEDVRPALEAFRIRRATSGSIIFTRSDLQSDRIAYGCLPQGLNGSQAAWAAKRYRGHRVIPSSVSILAKDNITNGNFC